MPILLNQLIYRPAAACYLPFSVRSAGYYKIRPPHIGCDKIITFSQLFWCVRGSGFIDLAGRRRRLKQHQIALLYPNMRHYWYADRQDWEFYWLTIDGPFASSMPAAFGLEAGIYDAGPAPVALFQKLLRLVGQPSKQAELHACEAAFSIFIRATGSHSDQTDELVDTAVGRMHKQYASPALNIKTLAASLGIRRVAFYTRFHAAMGIPPGAYLERLRIQKALSLLQHTHLSIATTAAQCGYTDANYFSRVICRTTGYSPLKFRQHNQPDTAKKK